MPNCGSLPDFLTSFALAVNMYDYRLGLMILLGLYLLSPLVMDWWLDGQGAWYRPFAIWLLLLVFYIWFNRQRGDDEL